MCVHRGIYQTGTYGSKAWKPAFLASVRTEK